VPIPGVMAPVCQSTYMIDQEPMLHGNYGPFQVIYTNVSQTLMCIGIIPGPC
jgi:hypothetical protein